MAAGRLPITFLLLSLHLGLGWVADPQEAPVADERSSEEMAETKGTWNPHRGKNSWGLLTPQFLLSSPPLLHHRVLPHTR